MNFRCVEIGKQRRGEFVKRLQRSRDEIQGTIDAGTLGRDGLPDAYLTSRVPVLQSEIDHLDAQITELESLGEEELVQRFVPESAAPQAATGNFSESLARGPVVSSLPWDRP